MTRRQRKALELRRRQANKPNHLKPSERLAILAYILGQEPIFTYYENNGQAHPGFMYIRTLTRYGFEAGDGDYRMKWVKASFDEQQSRLTDKRHRLTRLLTEVGGTVYQLARH